ncbi:MAG: phosphoribosylamine--glycine ligase, partial [Acidobacteria bacterium]|nr:phosphoribosylamine--glycine ligase [Acidobacteriota bacterium]
MKVLVVGSGGREHAIVWKISQSSQLDKLYCAPGNAGTSRLANNIPISADDIDGLLDFARAKSIDLTVVGPEMSLVAGIVDAFQKAGLVIFGPSAAAAELEGSKVFAKQLMQHANIPTAEFQVFDDVDAARNFLDDREERPLVVKADGLAAGKGAIVCTTFQEAFDAVELIMVDRAFGEAGERVVIEERLEGQEVSILALVQGKTIIPLESSQDHKPAYDGDRGP